MVNKLFTLLILSILMTACNGAKIEFTDPKVEKLGEGTLAEGITQPATNMSGTLVRPAVNDGTEKIISGGRTYQVGKYSSAGAYSFIQSRPLGSQTNVTFSGNTGRDTGYAPTPSASIDVINLEVILAQ